MKSTKDLFRGHICGIFFSVELEKMFTSNIGRPIALFALSLSYEGQEKIRLPQPIRHDLPLCVVIITIIFWL